MTKIANERSSPSEHKAFSLPGAKFDEEQGIVEHIIAVFGNVDEGGDRIHPGAFTKTLAERGHKIRVLDQHRTDSVMRVLGKPLALQEVDRAGLPAEIRERYPEATGGVKAVTRFLLDTPEGRGAFTRLREGAIDEWSFGYDAVQADYSNEIGPDGKGITVRNLRQIKLYEYGPVLWGMNPATMTVSAKSDGSGDGGERDEKDKMDEKDEYPWEQCIADQTERYGDEEIARRVCGAIRARSGGSYPGPEERAALLAEIETEFGVKPTKQGSIANLAEHLSNRYGADPDGWFERCMAAEETAQYDEEVRAAVCARAHYEALGKWPGEGRGADSAPPPQDGKAGRRLRAERVEQIKRLREALADLDDLLRWAEYEDEDDGKSPLPPPTPTAVGAGPDADSLASLKEQIALLELEIKQLELEVEQ